MRLMKTKIHIYISLCLYLILSMSFSGCSDGQDGYDYSNITEGNPLKMEASSQSIVLDLDKPNDRALIFTWEPARDRGPGTKITKYIFRLDVANNNFETSITSITMPEGVFFKSFTTKELNNLLRGKWNREEGKPVELEARIIAQAEHPDLYLHPDYSTIKLDITPYELPSKPLFIAGTATAGGWDLEKSLGMKELEAGELYNWRGELKKGNLKILQQATSLYPSYNMGATEHDMIEVGGENEENSLFNIPKDAVYSITLNTHTLQISIEEVKLELVALGGSATDVGWGENRMVLEWLPSNPHVCETIANIKAGELKFATRTGGWGTNPAVRPPKANASIQSDLDFIIVGSPDYKWKVLPEEAGRYKISVDIKHQKVSFDKIS